MYGWIVFFHLLGAAVWTGGHLVLALSVLPRALRMQSIEEIVRFEQAYERVGIPALLVQVATGLWLAKRLVPEWSDWLALNHPFSKGISVKLLLLLLTIGLALHARLRLLARLTPERLPVLAVHIWIVTLLSVLFVLSGTAFRAGWWF